MRTLYERLALSLAATLGLDELQFGGLGRLDGPTAAYSFQIATYDTISGFGPNKFEVDTSGFANSLDGGTFSMLAAGGTLFLNFTPVPEPSSLMAMAAIVATAGRRLGR